MDVQVNQQQAQAAAVPHHHVCPSALAPCAHAAIVGQIPTRVVNVAPINIPEYFENAIPVSTKSVYDVLGIKFVNVVAAGKSYYIYSACLADVVTRLGLYL